MPQPDPPLDLLRNRSFRAIWLASMTSNLGHWLQMVAAGWLMTSLTDSKTLVALVQSSVSLPIMVLAFISGVIADSFDRRTVMLMAQGFALSMATILATLTYLDLIAPWSLLALSFLIGSGMALNLPSWQTSIVDFVGKENLPSAVSLNSMGVNLMRSTGPAIGGFAVALVGAAAAFALNAASYLALILALLFWRAPPRENRLPRESLGRAVGAGLRYVSMSPNLQRVMFRGFLFGVSAVALQALLPLVVRNELGETALVYGVMLGCFGVGGVSGALNNARLRERFSGEVIVRGAFGALALGGLLIVLISNVYAAGIGLFMGGAGWVIALNRFNVTIQLSSPRWVVGRVFSLYQTCTFGGMAIGSWIWGAVSEATTTYTALLLAVAILCFGVIVGLKLPLPEYGLLNLEPLNRFQEPELHLDITPRSGPILITVEYVIASEDIAEFLEVMTLRRRIRIRDGAKHWALLRDLEHPERWMEKYHVPTWVEYVRHHARRTQADADVTERLLELHRGESGPKVHRQIERQTVPALHEVPRVIE